MRAKLLDPAAMQIVEGLTKAQPFSRIDPHMPAPMPDVVVEAELAAAQNGGALISRGNIVGGRR
jgi:hypothetical protein